MNVASVAPLPAAALMRAEAMRVLVLLRPTMARFAPSAASASAAAKPMPLVAPVIRMCLAFTAQQSHNRSRDQAGRLVRKLRVGSGMSWLVRQPKSTNSGTENVKSKRIFAPRIISDHIMVQEDFERLHKFLLETEGLSEVSDDMRELVEEEWPELVHKLPPKVS